MSVLAFPATRARGRWVVLTALLCCLGAAPLAVVASPDLGAWAADALRAVAGDRAVANLEDFVYGVRDRVDRIRSEGARPEPRWVALPPAQDEPPPAAKAAITARPADRRPADVGPLFSDFAADGDGTWVPIEDESAEGPLMYKTLIHPDRARSFAELFVVAMRLSDVHLHYVAGSSEPESVAAGAADYVRSARVPESDRSLLIAAFNGGFKTRHGHHGVEIDGVTLVPPRPQLCTLVGHTDGSLALATSEALLPAPNAAFVRQTARCLVENGERHPALLAELTTSWGAAVGGDTVIRRSAIGLGNDGRTLFVGVGNRITASAIADGMRHAGASTAAQLDVNEAFPRFLSYRKDERGVLVAESVAPGFHYRPDHYVKGASSRDFFYLTRRTPQLMASAAEASGAG